MPDFWSNATRPPTSPERPGAVRTHAPRDAYSGNQVANWARFNDGRFRVTTEAKLRPLARFDCSIVWRLISAFRAVRQPAED